MLESSKYNVIWKSASEPNIMTQSDSEYASFLKNLERACNKSGCMDSRFYTHEFRSKLSEHNDPSPNANVKAHSYEIAKYRGKFIEDYEKQMKKISKALLEEKRKERIMKREEGDIIKKKYELNRSLYELDAEVNSKKFKQDLKLNEEAENADKIHKRFYYNNSKDTRGRMKESVFNQIDKKGKSRQLSLNVSKLLREFNAKKTELDANAKDISKLLNEFEKQLERKENKQKQLLDEAEVYSQALQREKLKLQVQQDQIQRRELKQLKDKEDEDKISEDVLLRSINQSGDGIKTSEMERKSLDSQMNLSINDHKVKSCEYGGSLNSIRNKLRDCENIQRQLIENGNYLNKVLKNTELNRKLEEANSRKSNKIKSNQNDMINTRGEKEDKYSGLSKKRHIQLDLEEELENIGHLKDIIRRDKESERKYFKNMTDASKEIKQTSISINRVAKQLRDARNMNWNRINEEQRLSDKYEQQLEQELNRQKTKLIELQSQRNNYSIQLIECRKHMKGDEYNIKNHYSKSRVSRLKEDSVQNQSFLPIVS